MAITTVLEGKPRKTPVNPGWMKEPDNEGWWWHYQLNDAGKGRYNIVALHGMKTAEGQILVLCSREARLYGGWWLGPIEKPEPPPGEEGAETWDSSDSERC